MWRKDTEQLDWIGWRECSRAIRKSFWALALPMAALIAFPMEMGAPGLMMGMMFGVLSASLLLGWRFRVLSRRTIRRL